MWEEKGIQLELGEESLRSWEMAPRCLEKTLSLPSLSGLEATKGVVLRRAGEEAKDPKDGGGTKAAMPPSCQAGSSGREDAGE